MFEVNVKNVTEERRGGEGRGPARVWGSDTILLIGLWYKQLINI